MHAIAIQPKLLPALRWSGRVLGALLLLFWGAFFVEHLVEWFIQPLPRTPPLAVWMAQGLHFLMLTGLVLMWRWALMGGLLVIVASFVFFVDKAGANFPLFFAVTSLPAVLLIVCAWIGRSAGNSGTGRGSSG